MKEKILLKSLKYKIKFLFSMKVYVLIVCFVFLMGCNDNIFSTNEDFRENTDVDYTYQVERLCENMCSAAELKDGNITQSICLIDGIEAYPEWVCVISDGSQSENLIELCPSYSVGNAKHYVALDLDCKVLRSK